jgi:cellulose synthase/poly-beta-1,6-N-acetylglucosamine synthase-like glycosyltransferase
VNEKPKPSYATAGTRGATPGATSAQLVELIRIGRQAAARILAPARCPTTRSRSSAPTLPSRRPLGERAETSTPASPANWPAAGSGPPPSTTTMARPDFVADDVVSRASAATMDASRLIALMPAHNEAAGITAALDSVQSQPGIDTVIVVSDNSTDDTAAIARSRGAQVFETKDNVHKKAGALNQALGHFLPKLEEHDYMLVMDADSILDPDFVPEARRYFAGDAGLGGISGTFRGASGGGFVGMLQRNEYARYARDVRRLRGRALVLTGTASVFRVSALRDVLHARHDGRLPYAGGNIYDEKVLTEDNELTLALMHLGWHILAPKECLLTTEVMETWSDLARQRLRWKRGAFENLGDYGLTRITAPYWGRQLLSLLSVVATLVYLLTLSWTLAIGEFHWQPVWMAVTGIFVIERVVTVRSRGWRQMLIAAPIVIEMVFDVFLQLVQAWAFAQIALRRKATW